MSSSLSTVADTWLASLSLKYEYRLSRTVISARHHQGPLTVQKPFYPEQDVCHTYILHPPAGVVGGDVLKINIDVADKAHTLITTPGAGKFYRSENKLAQQHNTLKVKGSGVLEWFPQETILFTNSQVEMATQVELDTTARFCGWEITCLGRPASHDHYDAGFCQQTFALYRQGQPILIDRTVFDAQSDLLQAKWGLAGYPVTGVMVMTNANDAMLSAARDVIASTERYCAATLLDDVLVCRYVGQQGMHGREIFTQVWAALRPMWIGREAKPPRIWLT